MSGFFQSLGEFYDWLLRNVFVFFDRSSYRSGILSEHSQVDCKGRGYPMMLVNWRMARGISQGALARLLGCSQSAVGRWELGLANPSEKHLDALKALGFDGIL